MKPISDRVAISSLNAHPINSLIYSDEDVSELVELIRDSGWVKPLVVTPNHTIISSYRRWKAVCLLGWETVPVEYREFFDELAELEALLLENASQFRTTEQKVREALIWKKVDVSKVKRKQLTAQNNNAGKAVGENFPQLLQEKGKTCARVAVRVGLGSGRTYSKAAKVVALIDEIEERMLDVFQLREWFLPKQLIHLKNIYQLYRHADFFQTDKHLVSPMPGHQPLYFHQLATTFTVTQG